MNDPSKRLVTLRDIAKQLGVSHTTVSLALKGSPRVSEELRRKIQQFAQEVNYRPDPLLQQLASYKKTSKEVSSQSVIAWINDWEDPSRFFKYSEFQSYYDGAIQMAAKLGFRIEVFNTNEQGISPGRLAKILISRGIRGVIVPPQPKRYHIPDKEWSGLAVLRIGFNNPSPRNHVVGPDQFEGGRQAALGMLAAGYTRIGYVGNHPNEARMRYNFSSGFQSGRDPNVNDSDRVPHLFFQDDSLESGMEVYQRWLQENRVEAVLSGHRGVEEWTAALGLTFGKDLGLAGTSLVDSILDSGIDQHPHEIGAVAIQFLAQLIAHYSFEIPEISQRLLISPTFVCGSSLDRGDS